MPRKSLIEEFLDAGAGFLDELFGERGLKCRKYGTDPIAPPGTDPIAPPCQDV